MKSKIIWGLVVLNAVLLTSFLSSRVRSNNAVAQNPGTVRPGDYVMIPGSVSGGSQDLVYVIDGVNGFLTAISYDDSRGRLDAMPKINIAQAFQQAVGGVPPKGGKKPAR